MKATEVLFSGLPHTGKTTFIALLGMALTHGRKTSLRLGSYDDDREHVYELGKTLAKCEEADRTHVSQRQGLSMSLAAADGDEYFLRIPDLSGEAWSELVDDRQVDEEFARSIETADGLCIFVHAAKFENDPTIAEVDAAARALGDEHGGGPGLRDEKRSSGQVQLVELLQIVGDRLASGSRHLSIVVSAFDLVSDASPNEWIASNAPLAAQYLQTNSSRNSVRIFGLSAQGGSFADDAEKDNLKRKNPIDRASVFRGNGTEGLLDEPVTWALGLG